MYITQDIANRIKQEAKKKQLLTKEMLAACDLNINTISELSKGKQISFISFAKIADYLSCSVDYLLGRTDDTQVQNELELKPEEYPVIIKYRAIVKQGGGEAADKLLDSLYEKRNTPTAFSDERIGAILQNSNEMQQLMDTLSTMSREKLADVIRFVQFQKSLENSTNE